MQHTQSTQPQAEGNESITLYCQEGSADKVYQVELKAVEGGYIVTGFNGRRGSALKAQPKIASPVPYAEAKKEYDSLVRSKVKKGYHAGDAASDYIAANAGERSGMSLHLLTPASESDIERFLTDDRYIAQEKFDGERRPVARRAEVVGGNSKGFVASLPRHIVESISNLPFGCEIDAEQIGDTLHVFDAMKVSGQDIRDRGTLERLQYAEKLVNAAASTQIVLVETAIGTVAKRALYARLRATRAEGIVFKSSLGTYEAGRNESQWKVKFLESATLQVASVHPTKRSVAVQGYDKDGQIVPLGNVTIPANRPIPAVGEVVEIQYLYAVSSLYQPQYKGVRTDKSAGDCLVSQLKYRADISEEDRETEPEQALAA